MCKCFGRYYYMITAEINKRRDYIYDVCTEFHISYLKQKPRGLQAMTATRVP